MEVQLHIFLSSALDGGEQSPPCPDHFILDGKKPCTYSIGGWKDPRASLDKMAKRKTPIIAPAGNHTLIIQPIA
jgi:hypothetical protein